jgi:hypothetical protein
MKMTALYAALSGALLLGAATLAPAQSTPSAPARAVTPDRMENKAEGISREAYNQEKDRIEADAKAAKDACKSMKDNAKDICQAEAKGKEKLAKKELDYKKNPNDKNRQDVEKMKAEVAYEIAKEKCEDRQGVAEQASCKKQAKDEKDRAMAAVKGKKVATADTTRTTRSTSPAAGTTAPSSSPSGNISNTMSPSQREPSPNTNVQTQGTPTGSATSSGTTGAVDQKQNKSGG